MSPPLILVTGATGYIASLLIPQLLEKGNRVRAMARQPERLYKRAWHKQAETIRADVMESQTLAPALDGVHTAYYLIHSMSRGRGYTKAERLGAENFIRAAEEAGVEHIIYLGGLADPEQHTAPHLRSRIETGIALRRGKIPVTEFRAGVIVGSGSFSFEMIRFMTELFPVIPAPAWIQNRTQPIAVQNVIDYLLAALENENGRGGVFEIGGPEITTYRDLMLRYARVRGLRRKMLVVPRIPTWLMAFGVDLMTPVPRRIAGALIGSLSTDSIVRNPETPTVFPGIELIDYDAALRMTLEAAHPDRIQRVWEDDAPGLKALKHEGCFILHLTRPPGDIPNASPEIARNSRNRIGGPFGEIYFERNAEPDGRTAITLFLVPRGAPGYLFSLLLQAILRLLFLPLSCHPGI
ncbi:MAG: hypothetical protein KPEEDBHJ_02572 [Anaerolineales bacterium]|nr:hypothetical protein [Anaerolineales bacterium]